MNHRSISLALLLAACSPSTSSAPADGSSTCNAITNVAPIVGKTTHAGPPPAMTGGTVMDGTYVLTAMDKYNGTTGSNTHQETWIFSAGQVQIVAVDSSMSGEIRAAGTYATVGNGMTLNLTCPTSTSVMNPYTASATQLLLVNANDPNEIHTFTRQ